MPPGLPLGAAPMAYALWNKFLRHNPNNPHWANRDRFVLSAGHGSMSDGLTDELIRKLSIIDGLSVRSRTSSFAIKGRLSNIRDAGEQLHADYILEGSVFRAGPQLRINVQLVRVRDDFPLWSGRYERELIEIFAVQDDISVGIVNSLRLKLGRGRRRYETNVEAYDLYLHARAQPQRNRLTPKQS